MSIKNEVVLAIVALLLIVGLDLTTKAVASQLNAAVFLQPCRGDLWLTAVKADYKNVRVVQGMPWKLDSDTLHANSGRFNFRSGECFQLFGQRSPEGNWEYHLYTFTK